MGTFIPLSSGGKMGECTQGLAVSRIRVMREISSAVRGPGFDISYILQFLKLWKWYKVHFAKWGAERS
jgi:hypothetical protein